MRAAVDEVSEEDEPVVVEPTQAADAVSAQDQIDSFRWLGLLDMAVSRYFLFLAWAALYNALCVPLALMGLLPPWLAGAGMATSSLAVVLNALRLAR